MKLKSGFTLIEIMFTLVLLPSVVYGGIVLFNTIYESKKISQSLDTKNTMFLAKVLLIGRSQDVDSDGYPELFAASVSGGLPMGVPISAKDKWGNDLKYHAFDRGSANSIDTQYAHDGNNTGSDNIGVILSSGPDGIFQTSLSDVAALGDDLMELITRDEVRFSHGTLGGFKDTGGQVELLEASDRVVIGVPTSDSGKLVVSGDYLPDVDSPSQDSSQVSVVGDNAAIKLSDTTSGSEASFLLRTANGELTIYRANPSSTAWQGILKIDSSGSVNIQGDLNTSGVIRSSSGNIVFELGN